MIGLTATEDLVPVKVTAGSNALNANATVTVMVKRCQKFSRHALDRAVKEVLGSQWQYSNTPVEF